MADTVDVLRHLLLPARSVRVQILGCMVAAALLLALVPSPATAAPTPTVTIDDVVVTEGNTGTASATFSIQVSPRPKGCCPLSVSWATADGTAASPADYTASSGTVTLTRSVGTAQVTVPVVGDTLDEPNENFVVNLSGLVGSPGRIGDAQGVATITDDDPLPSISIDDVAVGEGNAGTTVATFTASLSAPSGKTVTVNWASSNGSATHPDDYASGSGSLTFAPLDTTETIDVTVNGDVVVEPDETFTIGLTGSVNATIADGSGTGTILDDELGSILRIDDPIVAEGNSGVASLTFEVTLSNPNASVVTVDWATSAGSAAAGIDYSAGSGTVTFAPLDISETVAVLVNGETVHERDETVVLDLLNATNAPLGDRRGVGTISNDDQPPSISIANASRSEGNTGTSSLTFDVALSGETELDATVLFATTDGTATADTDYVATSGVLTIGAGEPGGAVTVTVNGDSTYEADETVHLTLSDPTDVTIDDGSALGTIVNDDKATTRITLSVIKSRLTVKAKGILEPTQSGHRVKVTLSKKKSDRYVKIAARVVSIRSIKDRDGDGEPDGIYAASFFRPTRAGAYRLVARFKSTATHRASTRQITFTLS